MQKKLFNCTILGFIFVSIAGSISHFVFEWSGYNFAAGLIFPVNESTWEHLKLLYFPYIIWTAIEYQCLKKEKGILAAKLIGAAAGMFFITIFFYTYTGAIGKSIEILNILSFFIGVSASFFTDYFFIKTQKFSNRRTDTICLAGLIALGGIFIIFTISPPFIPLFKDPINSTFGI